MNDLQEIHLLDILEKREKVYIKSWSSTMRKRCRKKVIQSLKSKICATCVIGSFFLAFVFQGYSSIVNVFFLILCFVADLYFIRRNYFPTFYKNKSYIGKKGIITTEKIEKEGKSLQLYADVSFPDGTFMKKFYLGKAEYSDGRTGLSDDPRLNAKRLAYEQKHRGVLEGEEIACCYVPLLKKWFAIY